MNSSSPIVKQISSSENGKYKKWNKLLIRKYREKERRFLVEGELLIRDAMASGFNPSELIVREGSDVDVDLLCHGDTDIYSLSDNLFEKLSQTENGRSVIGVFELPNSSFDDFGSGDIVILDRLQDPGNVGTIIRTADAAGVAGIITMKGTVDPFSPKASRSAAGSIFRVPIVEVSDADSLRKALNTLGAIGIALDLDGAVDLYDMTEECRVAIMVGNEGAGLSRDLLEISDIRIKIPMREGIESLNAAMAFGIVIYERVRRKCRKS